MLKVALVNVTRSEKFWEIVYTLNPKIIGGFSGVFLTEVGKASGFKIMDRKTVSRLDFRPKHFGGGIKCQLEKKP